MTRVAIMRPPDRLEESARLATEMGFDVVCASPVDVSVRDSNEFRELLKNMKAGGPSTVIFTSAMGVKAAFELAEKNGYGRASSDASLTAAAGNNSLEEMLKRRSVVAIGPVTAAAAERFGLKVDVIPEEFTSEGLVQLLSKKGIEGTWLAVLRSSAGSRVLTEGLTKANARVSDIDVYDLVKRTDSPDLRFMVDEALSGRIDVFFFTSSLSAKTFIEAGIGAASKEQIVDAVNSRTVVAIGEPTKKTLEGYGVKVDGVPEKATFEDMLRLLKDFIQ